MCRMNKDQNFAGAIGLVNRWPINGSDRAEMSSAGLLNWAEAYLCAAELLCSECEGKRDTVFYGGPVMQTVGLSTELVLKALLRGGGKSRKTVRALSHNTYDAYCAARAYFDEQKFINLFLSNTSHLSAPQEVRDRLMERGEDDVDVRWRIYFDHLRNLDSVYDRPFRSRYVTPGEMVLPEADLVLTGTKILFCAMRERLPS